MKKTTLLLFLAAILTFPQLTACALEPLNGSCLSYQNAPFELSSVISIDGRALTCFISSLPNSGVTVTVTEPGRLNGISFEIPDGSKGIARVTLDGCSFEFDGDYSKKNGLPAVAALLRLDEEGFAGAEVVHASGIPMNCADFRYDFGSVRVFLGRDGFPKRFEGIIYGHDITVNVENFKVIREQQ